MKYGLKLTTLMTDSTSYILLDSKDEVERVFSIFEKYLADEEEDSNENWLNFIDECETLFCDDDLSYDFSVGLADTGKYVLVTDLGTKDGEPNKAYEFELVIDFTERF